MKIGYVPLLVEQKPGVTRRYADVRDQTRLAEDEGYDSVWIYDHLIYRFPNQPTEGVWEAWTILSGLAEATSRVELGTIVLCTQFRNPAVLAKMTDTLEEVSNGRVILGLGAGWHEPEFTAFGLPFDHRVGRFEEALQIIGPLLRKGQVDFRGEYYQATDCALMPRGPRPNGPPILIAGKNPRMLRLTAQHADMWNTAWLGSTASVVERKATIDDACRAVGRDPSTLGLTIGINVAYPDLVDSSVSTENNFTGSPAEIAATLTEFERLGASHLQVVLTPDAPAAISRFAESIRLYRAGAVGG